MSDGIENIASEEGASEHPRRRRRYKYKYRKKKKSKKKKLKKYLEYALWVVVIAAFIASLVILVREMDVTTDKKKGKKKKGESHLFQDNSSFVCKLQTGYIISQYNLI